MNFQVPQFIEVEDKVIGPLSFKQFLYIAGGVGLGYLFYNLLSFLPAVIRAIPALAAGGSGFALAFYKINDRPLIQTLEAAFWYVVRGRLYIWKKEERKQAKNTTTATSATAKSNVPKLSESKLKDISWSLDVNEKIK